MSRPLVEVSGLKVGLEGGRFDIVDEVSFEIAAVGFMGFGLQPPAADWGLMINENRLGLAIQPWPVALPVMAIGLLTVGVNLVTDGIARTAIGLDRGREG